MPSKERYAKMTPEQKAKYLDRRREYDRKYYEKNREKKLEYDRKYYEKNREKKLEYARDYRATHPQYRARESLRTQEYHMKNRERFNELARNRYHRCKARREAEWNEIMAEIQGASNV